MRMKPMVPPTSVTMNAAATAIRRLLRLPIKLLYAVGRAILSPANSKLDRRRDRLSHLRAAGHGGYARPVRPADQDIQRHEQDRGKDAHVPQVRLDPYARILTQLEAQIRQAHV